MLAAALHLILAMAPPAAVVPEAPAASAPAPGPAAPTEAVPAAPEAPEASPPAPAAPATPATEASPPAEPEPAALPAPMPVVAPVAPVTAAPVAPIPLPVEPTPPPGTEGPQYRWKGTGMFISAGVLGLVGFPFKIIATNADRRVAGEFDRGERNPNVCIESCYVGIIFNIISMPMLVSSAGLVGGGATLRGRFAAQRDATQGRLHTKRRSYVMMGVGFGAIVAGITGFAVSRVTMVDAATERQYVARRELGWWSALVGLYGGSAVAGYGVGYESGRRKPVRPVTASLAPMLSPRVMGLGVSGRF